MRSVIGFVSVLGGLIACASSGTGNPDPVPIFSGNSRPNCDFELVDSIGVVASITGGRTEAERELRNALTHEAERRGAHGVVQFRVQPPERGRVVVVSGAGSPSPMDRPPVTWGASGHAIRFVDPTCRK
jgi:hypothetical protein